MDLADNFLDSLFKSYVFQRNAPVSVSSHVTKYVARRFLGNLRDHKELDHSSTFAFREISVVRRDMEIRAREVGKEPLFFVAVGILKLALHRVLKKIHPWPLISNSRSYYCNNHPTLLPNSYPHQNEVRS